MSYPLPVGDLKFLSEEEVSNFNLEQIQEESETGYFFLVKLAYPESLHLEHNSYPLAPHSKKISYDDLSFYSKACLFNLQNTTKYSATKLVSSYDTKDHYLCHGLNLKFYVSKGLKILKIYKIISFTQSKFLKPFIEYCAYERSRAATIVYANLFKILANSLYGKLIETVENRIEAFCVFSRSEAMKRASSPLYKSFKYCSDSMSLVFLQKKKIVLNMAYHCGVAILELAKLEMQKLYYDQLKPSFNNELALITSDTDSFLLFTFATSEAEIIKKIWHLLDTSNFPKDSPFFSEKHKKVPGYLKSELPGMIILRAVALRSKCYFVEYACEGELRSKVTLKGVQKREHKSIKYESFLKCISFMRQCSMSQTTLQSKNHEIKLIEQQKVSYSSFDDKRYQSCAIHSYPHSSNLILEHKKTGQCFFCVNRILR